MLRVLASLVYLLLSLLAAPAVAGQHPNVLLLVADDFGYNDSAIYRDVFQQQPVLSMPALEAFANESIRFSRFYTESTCSASRAALLTGQYAARNGFMPVARGISADVLTLPEYFKSRGYATHLVGKWHVGEVNREAFPEQQGFDSSFGFLGQWFLKGPDAQGAAELKSPTYHNPWLRSTDAQGKLSYQQYQGHLEQILTEHSVKLIRQKNNTTPPWFIYHAFFAPHTPLEPGVDFAKQFANTPEGKYQAMLAQMDDNLKQIFAAVKETGQWDNTIIIFLSDNGSPEKHAMSNAPFSGGKAAYEEGGIRTPLVIKWHKNDKGAARRDDVVSIMDIYPSLVSALGEQSTALKNVDGVASLIPDDPQLRNTPLYFLTYGSLSVLSADGHYRLLRQWDAGKMKVTQLFKYDSFGLPTVTSDSWLEKIFDISGKFKNELFNDFLQWRNRLRIVPVYKKNQAIKGSDFLRTPMNPSFALAFSFAADDVNSKQRLLFQNNTMELYLEQGILRATVHGLALQSGVIQPGVCYRVVLSGEFYDRFSGVHNEIRTSHLHLVVNGTEEDDVSGEINSFESIDTSAATVMGEIKGWLSEPIFYSTQLLPNDKPIPSGFDQVMDRLSVCRAE